MIGLDTNILLRAVLDDHPVQSPMARQLLRSLDDGRRGLVSLAVLMEFFWVLQSRYKLSQARLIAVLHGLMAVEHLQFESLEVAGRALATYESGGGEFADAVVAFRHRELGAQTTFTFDRDAARRVPGMTLLA